MRHSRLCQSQLRNTKGPSKALFTNILSPTYMAKGRDNAYIDDNSLSEGSIDEDDLYDGGGKGSKTKSKGIDRRKKDKGKGKGKDAKRKVRSYTASSYLSLRPVLLGLRQVRIELEEES